MSVGGVPLKDTYIFCENNLKSEYIWGLNLVTFLFVGFKHLFLP